MIGNTISTHRIKNLTGLEIIQYFSLWIVSCTREDFVQAFRSSEFGGDHIWKLYQTRKKGLEKKDGEASKGLILFYLELDMEHQKMLFDYIFNSDFSECILQGRETKDLLQTLI